MRRIEARVPKKRKASLCPRDTTLFLQWQLGPSWWCAALRKSKDKPITLESVANSCWAARCAVVKIGKPRLSCMEQVQGSVLAAKWDFGGRESMNSSRCATSNGMEVSARLLVPGLFICLQRYLTVFVCIDDNLDQGYSSSPVRAGPQRPQRPVPDSYFWTRPVAVSVTSSLECQTRSRSAEECKRRDASHLCMSNVLWMMQSFRPPVCDLALGGCLRSTRSKSGKMWQPWPRFVTQAYSAPCMVCDHTQGLASFSALA